MAIKGDYIENLESAGKFWEVATLPAGSSEIHISSQYLKRYTQQEGGLKGLTVRCYSGEKTHGIPFAIEQIEFIKKSAPAEELPEGNRPMPSLPKE